MFKRFILSLLTMFIMIGLTGCGGDTIKGDWFTWGKSGYDGSPLIRILHIDKADNGSYLITMEEQRYEHKSAKKSYYMNNENLVHTTENDEVLNHKEALTWKRFSFFTAEISWNGTPLKLAKIYERKENKYQQVWQANKENLPMKDGKLLFKNAYYEKADKQKIDKVMADWRDKLKKQVGQETVCDINNRNKKLKAITTKVTIIENGKEEVFEQKG